MAFISGVTGAKRTYFGGNVKTKDNISEQRTQENAFSILGEHWNNTGEQGNRYPYGRALISTSYQ